MYHLDSIEEGTGRDNLPRDLTAYRQSERERTRMRDLLGLIPTAGITALDVGARDGHLSKLLAERYETVVAVDLTRLAIDDPRVAPVQGDVCSLAFASDTFDLVACCEVLEHIPPQLLRQACAEIARVARGSVVIGVPYRQDIRLGRTTCRTCGGRNPPWGHVNSLDEVRLCELFRALTLLEVTYVGATKDKTNAAAAALMDFAGNPYGTYEQEEGCIHCGARLAGPIHRTLPQKLATKGALAFNRVQRVVTPSRGNWIHMRFEKPNRHSA